MLSRLSELGREDGGTILQAKPLEGPPSSNSAGRPPFRRLDTFEHRAVVPGISESVEKQVLESALTALPLPKRVVSYHRGTGRLAWEPNTDFGDLTPLKI